MATTTDIPVQVSEEAKARIAELGMGREFEQMAAHAKRTMAGTQRIEVTLEDSPDEPGDLRVVLWVHRPCPGEDDRADWDYGGWFVRAFPPEVRQHFCVLSFYGADDGR